MENVAEAHEKSLEWQISAAAVTTAIPHTRHPWSPGLETAQNFAQDARCLWCDRTFTPRATGGSSQKFCCTGHRQQFWIAARRWTMRAIEAGLLSVDCLKASHTSVHAA